MSTSIVSYAKSVLKDELCEFVTQQSHLIYRAKGQVLCFISFELIPEVSICSPSSYPRWILTSPSHDDPNDDVDWGLQCFLKDMSRLMTGSFSMVHRKVGMMKIWISAVQLISFTITLFVVFRILPSFCWAIERFIDCSASLGINSTPILTGVYWSWLWGTAK